MRLGGPLAIPDLDDIDRRSKQRIDAAVEFAKASPLPDPADLRTHVFVESKRR
jgi:TPP-dependent pyruvate/acetoin dehydrogenase alpha subunit